MQNNSASTLGRRRTLPSRCAGGRRCGSGSPSCAPRKSIDLRGIDLFRVRDGRIASIEIYYDTLGLMQQLGLAPLPAEVHA